MFIAIIGAMDTEISRIYDSLTGAKKEEIKGFSYITGFRGDHKIVATKSGIGKVNMAIATTNLINNFDVDLIINTGIAGSVDTKINSICIATKLMYHDMIIDSFDIHLKDPVYPSTWVIEHAKENLKNITYGTFLTGDQFVTSIDMLHGIDTDGVVSIDMESMALAVTAKRFNKDFLVIRSISDNLSLDIANKNEFNAAEKSLTACLNYIDSLKC